MTGRTHDLAAISALLAIFIYEPLIEISLSTLFLALLFNQIGGILPDIDQPTAPFWRNLPVGKLIGKIIDKSLLGGHRFLTHSLLGAVIFGGLFYFGLLFLKSAILSINVGIIWISFMVGVLSHLLLDSFTKEGIPLLLPITKKIGFPFNKQLRITTGKSVEYLVVIPVIIFIDIFLISSNYSYITHFFKYYII